MSDKDIDPDVVFDLDTFNNINKEIDGLVVELEHLRRKILNGGEDNFDWQDMVISNKKEIQFLTNQMLKFAMIYRMMNATHKRICEKIMEE